MRSTKLGRESTSMRWKASRMKYAMRGSTMHDTAHVHMCSDEMTGRHFRPTISSTASTPTPACTANLLTATRLTDDVAAHFHAVQRGGLQEAQGDERVNLADEALREGGDELHGRRHHDDASPAEPAHNKLCDGSTVGQNRTHLSAKRPKNKRPAPFAIRKTD